MSLSQPFTPKGKRTADLLLSGFSLKPDEKNTTQIRPSKQLIKAGSSRLYSPISTPQPSNVKFPSAERLSKPLETSLVPNPTSWTPLREARRGTCVALGITKSKNVLPALRATGRGSPGSTQRTVPFKAMALFQTVGKRKTGGRGRKTLGVISGRLKRLLSDPVLDTPPPLHFLGVIRVLGSPLKSPTKRR